MASESGRSSAAGMLVLSELRERVGTLATKLDALRRHL
jgi:hypothetical protein